MKIVFDSIDFSYYHSGDTSIDVLRSFSLYVESKEIVSIVGPSGCGKSTILKLIPGLIQPNKGVITIGECSSEAIREKGEFGLVFQSPNLLPWRTVEQNIQLPFELKKIPLNLPAIHAILNKVSLTKWAAHYPHQLSGGMQQRVALARAMVSSPKVLLLDEPFSQLDEVLRFELLFYVRNYAKENGITVVLVTHDISEAVISSDTVFVLADKVKDSPLKIKVALPPARTLETTNTDEFYKKVSQVRMAIKGN